MSEKRGLTIHFNDDTKISFEFDKQFTDESTVVNRLEKLLDKPYLMVEVEGAVLLFPMTSVKYIQAYPGPSHLPDYAIKGARIV